MNSNKILILDFGSQYSQLIARRVREQGVYCELWAYTKSTADIQAFQPAGIILSGGPESTIAVNTPRAPDIIFELGCPILGICYGMQTLVMQQGGKVSVADKHEYGYAQVILNGHHELLNHIEDHTNTDGQALLDVWMSHGDQVTALPPGFKRMAYTNNCEYAAVAEPTKHWYGIQFHPEVTHTRQGERIISRFVHDICGCDHSWKPGHIVSELLNEIQRQVGDERVLLGLSGGVDSSVLAALLHNAIGDRLTCVFVDNGLLRQNEAAQVMQTIAQHMGIRVIKVDATELFITALAGETDPEKKRKIIGNTFIDIFEAESQKLEGITWLAQGTIYPDVIESAGATTGKAHVIKSHHNVGGLPEHMNLKLLEPLKLLFKDEVRKIGLELGLPHDMVYRHPFPGPGLGVRVLGEIKEHYLEILRQADAIFIQALRDNDWYDKVSQAFAVFLPVKSVGVVGDARQYEYVIALRAVETTDFMTAHWAHLPYELLGDVSRQIINEVKGVSRVVYDVSGKPPATIEWE